MTPKLPPHYPHIPAEDLPRRYLLIDDNGDRSDMFVEEIAADGQLEIIPIFKPHHLRRFRLGDIQSLSGVIIDFHLDTSTSASHEPLLYQLPGSTEDAIPVTTGLGVMLWLKTQAPDVPLLSLCESSAPHARLFMTAAQAWLDCNAIDANDANEVIREVLTIGDAAEGALDINRQIAAAAKPFSQWMDSLLHQRPPAEAYDWLQLYRFCGTIGARAELQRRVRDRHPGRTVAPQTYVEMLCTWQSALADFLRAFDSTVDLSDWPDLTPWPQKPEKGFSTKLWDRHNPVLDYVNHGSRELFFTAPDVRAALQFHRSAHPPHEDDHAP